MEIDNYGGISFTEFERSLNWMWKIAEITRIAEEKGFPKIDPSRYPSLLFILATFQRKGITHSSLADPKVGEEVKRFLRLRGMEQCITYNNDDNLVIEFTESSTSDSASRSIKCQLSQQGLALALHESRWIRSESQSSRFSHDINITVAPFEPSDINEGFNWGDCAITHTIVGSSGQTQHRYRLKDNAFSYGGASVGLGLPFPEIKLFNSGDCPQTQDVLEQTLEVAQTILTFTRQPKGS